MLVYCAFPDLRKCEEQGELLVPVVFILLVVLSVLLYFAVSLMDPGFVLGDTVKVDIHCKTCQTHQNALNNEHLIDRPVIWWLCMLLGNCNWCH